MTEDSEKKQKKKLLTLREKQNIIMQEFPYMQKTGTVAFGKTNYKFVGAEAMMIELRKLLAKYRVSADSTQDVLNDLLKTTVRFVNLDDEKDFIEQVSFGFLGTTNQSIAAAYTHAVKNVWSKFFMIPTGEEDPEKFYEKEEQKKLEAAEKKKHENERNRPITKMQENNLISILKDHDDIKQAIFKGYEIKDLSEIKKVNYEKVIVAVENRIKEKEGVV